MSELDPDFETQYNKYIRELQTDDEIDPGFRVPNLTLENPLTGEELPIYLTSYVAADYGCGAVMGVPAHNDKDKAFADKNQL